MFQPLESVSRRSAVAALLGAGGAAFIPAWNEEVEAADTLVCVAQTPTVTEGPYWVDEKLFRSDIRTDPSTGVARAGVPLSLTINVQNLSGGCAALAGAYVDIWHCDAKGIYSDEPTYNPGGGTGSVNTSGQKFLRGYQITDSNGSVTFTTIYPGWYSGRTVHIHFRVRTYNGSTVLSNFVSQIFFDETANNTVLASSAYSRTTGRDTTNANDMVYSVANKERMLTTANGSVAAGYTASITVAASFQNAVVSTPAISANGVGNAVGGSAGAASGAWISIYGTNLASAVRALATSDIVNNTIPATLGGVSVSINSKPAFVQYVSPTQVNVLAPTDTSVGPVNVTVTNSAGTSNAVVTNLATYLPGLSVASNYVRAVRYPDGAVINGTGAAEAGFTTAAAVAPGVVIALFGTGFGPTNATTAVGQIFTGAFPTTSPVTVTIGGVSALVAFAGLVGPGLYQINVTVPTVADGDQTVLASVGGVASQATAKLKVSASAQIASAARSRPAFPGDLQAWIRHLVGPTPDEIASAAVAGPRMIQIG
jgi:uncharacterized protein (TIGR03437 family)